MAIIDLVMPKMGESVMEATVLEWLKSEGDTIEQDESVLEVATDKVDTEVPSPHSGVLVKILAQKDDVIPVGQAIAQIETDADVSVTSTEKKPTTSETEPVKEVAAPAPGNTTATSDWQGSNNGFFSPLIKSMAKEEGISTNELSAIQGTGKDQRLTKADFQNYLSNRGKKESTAATPAPMQSAESAPKAKPFQFTAGSNGGMTDEIIEMDRMRTVIADRMVESKKTSAHVTSFVEADVTDLMKWRSQHKNNFKAKYGGSLTVTPILIEALAKALKDYPMMNVSVDGKKIIRKADINVGMAVALPSGNLVVPVIKGAGRMNLMGIALAVNDLAKRARENNITADELSGGTYTMSNMGTFGNLMGTPIIVQPQVGIMAFGVVRKKPVVIESPQGDTIGIRQTMILSHSYDHRVVDGALGGMFVRRVADYLEQFDAEQTI